MVSGSAGSGSGSPSVCSGIGGNGSADLRQIAEARRKAGSLPHRACAMTSDVTLDDLRRRINEIDDRLIELAAERKHLSQEVARVKRSPGRATRDYEREREVILAARTKAEALGVSGDVAEELLRILIRSSLTTQEQASVVAQGAGSGRRALIIGGAGKMGRWFADFLTSQGFTVEV